MAIDYKSLKGLADSLADEFRFLRYEIPMQDLFKISAIIDQTIKRLDKENDINE